MNVSAIDEVKIKHLPVHDELIKVEVFSEGHTIFFVALSILEILYKL